MGRSHPFDHQCSEAIAVFDRELGECVWAGMGIGDIADLAGITRGNRCWRRVPRLRHQCRRRRGSPEGE
jgi:hypothetical protein